jgi:signal transduction histidine kinase
MQLKLERLEHQRAIERERQRIARDIHDDLGANLTQIALLSELAQADLQQPQLATAHLNRIFTTARNLARQLDETVWAINPANDSLENLAAFLSKFAQDYLSVAGIRCRLDLPETLPHVSLTAATRHNLFLSAKESLHNVVKHAHATQVRLRIRLEDSNLILSIEDDGQGLPPVGGCDAAPGNDGLINMEKRMVEVGGQFQRESKPGQGTTVTLTLPGVSN